MFRSATVDIGVRARPARLLHAPASYKPDLRLDVWLRRKGQCVFNCWTIPEYMELISPNDGSIRASSELGEGGQFSITSYDFAKESMLAEGSYLVLDSPYYLKCAWNFYRNCAIWKSVVRLHFTEMDGGTQLRLVQTGGSPDPALIEAQKAWWKQRFVLMRKLLA